MSLDKLREVAEAAGHGLGSWRVEDGHVVGTEVNAPGETFVVSRPAAFLADAEFIATFDPPTVRVLLDIAEAADDELHTTNPELLDALARLREVGGA